MSAAIGHLLIMGQAGFLDTTNGQGIRMFAREVYPRLKETMPDTAISGLRRTPRRRAWSPSVAHLTFLSVLAASSFIGTSNAKPH